LLISYGADKDNVNDVNFTPSYHIFQPQREPNNRKTSELLDIMEPYALWGLNTQSVQGWTPAHRAAAFGNGEDMSSLIERGADIDLQTYELGWTPVFVAVHYRNISTFKRLTRYLNSDFVHSKDFRGWTLLHIAAEAGAPELVALLLKLGADPHRLSEICDSSFILDDMRGIRLSPTDIARRLGRDKFLEYVKGLENGGLDFAVDFDDIFWPAEYNS
jgi:ankyrin repeat protein